MTPYFFGYGSLVNTDTHDYPDAQPAQLNGWRRIWRQTSKRPFSFLSAHQVSGAIIDGLIAKVPNADWAALDEREAAYVRRDVSLNVTHSQADDAQIAVYEVEKPWLTTDHPILLSYLDVVIQGYEQVFGPTGPAHFFETTDDWTVPILNDRANPIYPRHQTLTTQTRATVDAGLTNLSAVVKQLE
jgi:hypothetical protein